MRKLLCLSLLSSLPAMAGTTPDQQKTFDKVDRNHDGRITVAEFVDRILDQEFSKLDTKGTGKVDISEWLAVNKDPNAKEEFQALDTNKDGVLERKELCLNPAKRSVLEKVFLTLDPNHDGVLLPTDLPSAAKK